MFNISDNASSVLIKFSIKLSLKSPKLETNKFTRDIPSSLYTLRKLTGLNKKYYKAYTSCPMCHSFNSNLNEKICKNIKFPETPGASIHNASLLKIIKKKDKLERKPLKVSFINQ